MLGRYHLHDTNFEDNHIEVQKYLSYWPRIKVIAFEIDFFFFN